MMKAVERAFSNASRTAPKYWPASIRTAARPARAVRQALRPGLIRDEVGWADNAGATTRLGHEAMVLINARAAK